MGPELFFDAVLLVRFIAQAFVEFFFFFYEVPAHFLLLWHPIAREATCRRELNATR